MNWTLIALAYVLAYLWPSEIVYIAALVLIAWRLVVIIARWYEAWKDHRAYEARQKRRRKPA